MDKFKMEACMIVPDPARIARHPCKDSTIMLSFDKGKFKIQNKKVEQHVNVSLDCLIGAEILLPGPSFLAIDILHA